MSSIPSQKSTTASNELAKQRNRAAAERTLTSWIHNCLSVIGFGIAFDRIFNALNDVLFGLITLVAVFTVISWQ
ncbi:DUF202 domain-containing protein [Fischerella sp. PCC 9605]|uniref:DUF202 domain-containing protein n=1 Tax=Fischerella sp. PCC 9605 TaxID=1173024 RepID=UPI00047ED329|nr:DUF202 domain-containing protein [Fischerella sp. PCC 9605]